jgi:hypothetical protein
MTLLSLSIAVKEQIHDFCVISAEGFHHVFPVLLYQSVTRARHLLRREFRRETGLHGGNGRSRIRDYFKA